MVLQAATGDAHPTLHQDSSGNPAIAASHAFAMALGPNGSYYLLYRRGSHVHCWKSADLTTPPTDFRGPTAGSHGPAICRDGSTYWVAYREHTDDSSEGATILVGKTNDPSKSLPVENLRAGSEDPFPDADKDEFPDTDKPVACCLYAGQPIFAFKRGKHEVALIWNTGGTWHSLPRSTEKRAEYPKSLAIPNPDGYVEANKNKRGAEWVVTSRSPACTSVVLDGQDCFFLAFKENGGGSLWTGHVFEPGKAASWPKGTLSKAKVGDMKLKSEVAPAVVEYKGDVLMIFSNEKDEGNQDQFDSIKDKRDRKRAQEEEKKRHENRLWLALFDGGDKRWETAYRLVDDQGEMLPKPSQAQKSNINLLVDHDGNDVLLSYSDEEKKIRLFRLQPTET